jgi:hypothetical protein
MLLHPVLHHLGLVPGLTQVAVHPPHQGIDRRERGAGALLTHPRLRLQLLGLERRVARSGKDSIDHPPGGHDDVANAAASALVTLLDRGRSRLVASVRTFEARRRVLPAHRNR